MKKYILLSALFIVFAFASNAQQRTPRVNARQNVQHQRIAQGVKSGELTKAETKRLAQEQKMVNRAEHRAKLDGKVTRRERRRLNHMQNVSSRDIKRQKNDVQSRN